MREERIFKAVKSLFYKDMWKKTGQQKSGKGLEVSVDYPNSRMSSAKRKGGEIVEDTSIDI